MHRNRTLEQLCSMYLHGMSNLILTVEQTSKNTFGSLPPSQSYHICLDLVGA
jgi:hypothetical protein